MTTKAEQVEEQYKLKRYKVQSRTACPARDAYAYPISAYTFPQDGPGWAKETRIHQVYFSDEYLHVELTDGRKVAVPLWWIPTLYNAPPEEREKYEISPSREMIIWDPERCAINDELRIRDYLGQYSDSEEWVRKKRERERRWKVEGGRTQWMQDVRTACPVGHLGPGCADGPGRPARFYNQRMFMLLGTTNSLICDHDLFSKTR